MGAEARMNSAKAIVVQRMAELEQLVAARWTPEVFRRFQCIWLTHTLALTAHEIAKALDLNVSTVRRIRAEFLRDGTRVIDGKGNRGGRRNQCLSFEEEAAFLRQHAELCNRSGSRDSGALKEAFEACVGRTIHKTTIYRLLERHGLKKGSAEAGRLGGEAASAASRRIGSPGPKRKASRAR